MSQYNPLIHHRRSIRLYGYDYSQMGLYFITICCKDKACLFGEIIEDENIKAQNLSDSLPTMVLNNAGKMAHECWLNIPNHFPTVILHEFVIMPNHVHGIIELKSDLDFEVENIMTRDMEYQENTFQKMIPRSIGSIIKGFKIGVTKWFRIEMADDFPISQSIWQRNYYEHIIRDEQSYFTISDYIINNPANWEKDKFYMPKNGKQPTRTL